MKAHSNYISVESDAKTVMYLIIAVIIGAILYYTFKLVKRLIKRHYYKQFRAKYHNIEQYKQIKAQKERAYQNTVNNFFYNRIEEDINNMPDKKPSVKAKKIIDLYNKEK
jgi:ABC-type bacteriocin/lantibiotic exporter with double-glycine peptidase domain